MFLLLLLLAGLQGIVAAQTRPLTSREFGCVLDDCFKNDIYKNIFNSNYEVVGKIMYTTDKNNHDEPALLIGRSMPYSRSAIVDKESTVIVLDAEKFGLTDLCFGYDRYAVTLLLGGGSKYRDKESDQLANLYCSSAMKKFLMERYTQKREQEIAELQKSIDLKKTSTAIFASKLASLPESVAHMKSDVNH